MTNTPSAVIGANIRAEMARRGVSQTELAAHLDVSQSSFSKRLRGLIPLDVNELTAVAEFLDIPRESLLTETVKAVTDA